MNLYVKFFILILKRLFNKKKLTLNELCVTKFQVSFMDLDLNLHMNNGRFFSVMDLGRFDLMIRSGHFFKLMRNGFVPIVLSENIVFNQSLGWLNRYELHTEFKNWDDKFFYIKQKFVKKGKVIASAHVRGCFKKRGRKGIIPVKEIFDFINVKNEALRVDPLVVKHKEIDELLFPRKS
jgi:acyl-CoA thioesterase FadM